MLVSSLVMMSLVKPTGEMLKLVDRLQDLLTIPVARYLSSNLYVLSTIAFTRCRHCSRWLRSAVCGAGRRCSS